MASDPPLPLNRCRQRPLRMAWLGRRLFLKALVELFNHSKPETTNIYRGRPFGLATQVNFEGSVGIGRPLPARVEQVPQGRNASNLLHLPHTLELPTMCIAQG